MGPKSVDWRVEFPASLEELERFCDEFRVWRARACPYVEPFATELLLRETLTNSVIHGCGEDPSQRVECTLRAGRNRLLIAVRDSGSGFDWRSRLDTRQRGLATQGRGMEIIRRYATAVRFNSEGNAVTLMKRSGKAGSL